MEPFIISSFIFIYFISYSCITYKLNQDVYKLNIKNKNKINQINDKNNLIIYIKYKIKNIKQFKKNKIYPFN